MRLLYIGNFLPEFSTENDIRQTLVDMHVEVACLQEDDVTGWRHAMTQFDRFDGVLWTSTKSLAAQIPNILQYEFLYQAHRQGIPTIGFHLDRWWGLERWRTVLEAPFFRCSYVFTADGAHDAEFAAAGVNHHWSPPAIAPRNLGFGEPDPMYKCDVAFVGSWQGGYHAEWKHRAELITWLQRTYGTSVRFFPERGQEAIRGKRLADLYASATVVVGDSCLVPTVSGEPMHRYCSDRVFETVGRGGLLVHPFVAGVVGWGKEDNLMASTEHLYGWELNDWGALRVLMEDLLAGKIPNHTVREDGWRHVAEYHTYANRLDDVFFKVGLDGHTSPALVLP